MKSYLLSLLPLLSHLHLMSTLASSCIVCVIVGRWQINHLLISDRVIPQTSSQLERDESPTVNRQWRKPELKRNRTFGRTPMKRLRWSTKDSLIVSIGAINKGIIAHPSHSSYGNEEKENAPAPKKRKEFRPKTVAPIRKQTKTIKKPTPLMNKVLRMAGRKWIILTIIPV